MAVYRIANIGMVLKDLTVKVDWDVERSPDGTSPWTLVQKVSVEIKASKNKDELINQVVAIASQVRDKDEIENDSIAAAVAALEGRIL